MTRRLIACLCLLALPAWAQLGDIGDPGAFWQVRAAGGGAPAWSPPQIASLQLWHGFNNNNTNVTDLSGNGQTGAVIGNPTWNAGGYWTLDGTGDWVNATSVGNGYRQLSLACWVRPTATKTYDALVFSRGTRGSGFYLTGTSNLVLYGRTEANVVVWSGTTTANEYTQNAWHHLCFSFNADTASIIALIDGVNWSGAETASTNSASVPDVWRFGVDDFDPGRVTVGDIDSLMIWQAALTTNELLDVMNHTGTNAPSGLEGDGT